MIWSTSSGVLPFSLLANFLPAYPRPAPNVEPIPAYLAVSLKLAISPLSIIDVACASTAPVAAPSNAPYRTPFSAIFVRPLPALFPRTLIDCAPGVGIKLIKPADIARPQLSVSLPSAF